MMLAESLAHLEVRFAPQLHGHDWARAVDAVLDGLHGATSLVLCGLYGEPPSVLERLIALASTRPRIVGIDLAGAPLPNHRWQLLDYAPVCKVAHDVGLGVTIHAGEGRPPSEIAVAVSELSADRIGHGVTLMDDPRVLELVLNAGVTIEACSSSNVHTGVIQAVSEHPIRRGLMQV